MSIIASITRYRMNRLGYYLMLCYRSLIKKLSFRKLPNMVHCVADWLAKRPVTRSRPVVVRLEVSATCNLKCLSCRTAKKVFMPGEPRLMSLMTFTTIFRQLAPYVFRATFYMEGEPMTNPHLFEMVRLANDGTVYTSFSTNFTLMRTKQLKAHFDSGLDLISIALDGFSQEAYEKYRVNGDVARVKEGIEMVMKYKKEHRLKHPTVNVYTILFQQVLPELPQIAAFCKKVGVDRLTIRPDESNLGGTYTYSAPKGHYSKCFWPWLGINVDVDGSVYPCPIAFEMEDRVPYGNLSSQSLDEIWNNPIYVATRHFLAGRKERSAGLHLPCMTCRWYGDSDSTRPQHPALLSISTERITQGQDVGHRKTSGE
jgi:radical SAM protein with 4Fe4S-binding SPASM domain